LSEFKAGSKNKIDTLAKNEQMKAFSVTKKTDYDNLCPKDKHKVISSLFLQLKTNVKNKSTIKSGLTLKSASSSKLMAKTSTSMSTESKAMATLTWDRLKSIYDSDEDENVI